jgi:small subunit ribosomal protein S6
LGPQVYEGMFILDSNRFGRDPDGVSGQISSMIEKLGGEMLVSRLWEERRLAYTIKGQRKGTYWLTYFRLGGGQFAPLRRQCEINENIMRFLFLKIDPRIVDALVAHAQSAPVPVVAPAAPVPAEPAAVAAKPDAVEAVEEIDGIEEELEE